MSALSIGWPSRSMSQYRYPDSGGLSAPNLIVNHDADVIRIIERCCAPINGFVNSTYPA